MDGKDYKPNKQVLGHLKGVNFVAVVGPTAAGKSTLMKAAMAREPHLHMVMNNTSREPRDNEREGKEYHFHTRHDMLQKIAAGEYVQVAPTVFGDLYATAPEDYSRTGIAMLPTLADAMPIFRALPFKLVRSLYVLPPSWDDWQTRLKDHGLQPEKLPARLHEALRSLTFALEDEDTHLIINHGLDIASEDFITLALGEEMPPRLQADQSRGREIAAELLEHLQKQIDGL